jgi:hypothetical protein
MNKKFTFCVLALLVFTLALLTASCKTAEFGFEVVDVNGMIYDFANRPVAYCDVSLGRWHKSSTDINGRFTITKVPLGKYTITGHKKGYEHYSDEVIIRDKGQIIYIRLPSQNQLLSLLDEALTANNLSIAEEMAERAFHIDPNNQETLLYYAAVKFRQKDYQKAISFLETAKNLGSKDSYVDKFLTQLKEI